MRLSGIQARAVGRAFARYSARSGLIIHACAILRDHVHLVVDKPSMRVEQLVIQLKGEATEQLIAEGLHPQSRFRAEGKRIPKCWVQGHWKVYLDPDDVPRAIRYVENNPVKEGLKKQDWWFVTSYPHEYPRSTSSRP